MARTTKQWEDRIGRRLRLRDLYILSTVAEQGSMAKAAAYLSVSQPAVSDAIANLEAALGVRLLDRSPHGVAPTIYSDALLKRGHVVFDELYQGIRDIEFLANPTAGEIRIGSPESLAPICSAIIDQMSRRYPKVVVHVGAERPSELDFSELRERKVDLLFTRVISSSLIDDDIGLEVLFQGRLFVVAGTDSPWTRRKTIELADLVNEPWILLPSTNAVSALIEQAFRSRGLNPPQPSATADVHLRIHLLATGRFLTVLPTDLLQLVRQRWSLKPLPIDLGIQAPSIGILTIRNRTLSPVTQLFIDCAREVTKSIVTGRAADTE
jgi:DNA-binding transcriptional LysR family regulator